MARILGGDHFSGSRDRAGRIAEDIVARILAELPDSYTVIRNVAITRGATELTELDAALVTPSGGVMILETKAGDLAADENGVIERTYGRETKDLTAQFTAQRRLVIARLSGLAPGIPMRLLMLLPTGRLTAPARTLNALPSAVIDEQTIRALPETVREFEETVRLKGSPVTAQALCAFFENHYQYRPVLSSVCGELEARLQENASGLATWVPRIDSPIPVFEVEAPAGAGKTQLALALLRQGNARNLRTCYLNFSRNIVERLQKNAVAAKTSFIGTWHELAREKMPGADPGGMTAEARQAWFREASDHLCGVLSEGRLAWDLVVVDDAEDFEPEWLAALASALTDTGRLYVLSDPLARIRGEREPVEFSESTRVVSHETARVPKKQAAEMVAMGLVPADFTTSSPYEGRDTLIEAPYTGPDSLRKATQRAVETFLAEGFEPEQIAVLSWHGIERSAILPFGNLAGLDLRKPTAEFRNGDRVFTEGRLLADTVRRFRGLQAPAVVVTEMDFTDIGDKEKALLYHAMSRASMRLAFVVSEDGFNALSRLAGS